MSKLYIFNVQQSNQNTSIETNYIALPAEVFFLTSAVFFLSFGIANNFSGENRITTVSLDIAPEYVTFYIFGKEMIMILEFNPNINNTIEFSIVRKFLLKYLQYRNESFRY